MRRALVAAAGLAAAVAAAQAPLDERTAAAQAQADVGAAMGDGLAWPDRGAARLDGIASRDALRALAKGTLWRSQLSADSSLALRWRRGGIGLYLTVRLDER